MTLKKKIVIIGSGFSGLAAACCLAKAGADVTVLEKNEQTGGRARSYEADGFLFDMGPSWYWMPDVFENFFQLFGKNVADYYVLKLLSPSFSVFFNGDEKINIPESEKDLENLFESIEKGSALQLRKFLKEGKYKYEVGMKELVYKPALSWMEFADRRVLGGLTRLHILQSFQKYVRRYFKHKRLISILEFPVLFLGAQPKDTPALYSLMNYAGLSLGTWYPMGGMKKIIDAMENLALSLNVKIITNTPVTKISVADKKVTGVYSNEIFFEADSVIASSDYHFTEEKLLAKEFRNYSGEYWSKRTMAPSSIIFYLGLKKKIKNLEHHNLFFDEDLEQHAKEIYETPKYPARPLFYVCCPSKTDDAVAPIGMENLFILIPIAAGLNDDDATREKYFDIVISRLEKKTGENIREHIIHKRSYAINDFQSDYNAFKGNAYGLANTLRQTAVLKPSIRNKKLKNLFYTGQLTVPGPGVPPALISGQIVAKEVIKQLNLN